MELRNRINWVTVFVYVVLIALGFVAAIGLFGITGQIQFGKDAPAWVQAIGSIIAILIAIAIPAVQHKLAGGQEEAAMLNKARSLGLYIRPSIEDLAKRLDAVWDYEDPENFQAMGYVLDTNQCCLGEYAFKALQIPQPLISSLAKLHGLGPAAAGILRAIHCIQSAEGLTTQGSSGGKIIYDMKLFYDHLWDATKGATDSLNAIDAFFPRGTRK